MDLETTLETPATATLRRSPGWMPTVGTAVATLLVLGAVKTIYGLPSPLLKTLAVAFLVCSLALWITQRRITRPAGKHAALLLLSWAALSALVLGAVHHIDRSGWVWLQLTGYDVTFQEDLRDRLDLSVDQFTSQHPLFAHNPQESSKLIVSKGQHDIRETIVVPGRTSVTIEPGTVLRFGPGCSLISYSPIIARGTADAPIVFTARHPCLKWGVVGIVSTGKSVFEHVHFEHGRHALINNILLPGTLTLVNADVEIRNSRFQNIFGKDAINVRNGDVLICHNTFRDAWKDGLDLDGATGEVHHNLFVNCDDEGIDLSQGCEAHVFGNTVLDPRGGRIGADRNLEDIKRLNVLGYSGNR